MALQGNFFLRCSIFYLTRQKSTFFEFFTVVGCILGFNFLVRKFVAFVRLDALRVKLLAQTAVRKVNWSTSIQSVCTDRVVKTEDYLVVFLLIKL